MKVGKIFQDLSQNWLKLKIFFIFIFFLMGNFGIFVDRIYNSKWHVPTKIKLELPPELKVESRRVMQKNILKHYNSCVYHEREA